MKRSYDKKDCVNCFFFGSCFGFTTSILFFSLLRYCLSSKTDYLRMSIAFSITATLSCIALVLTLLSKKKTKIEDECQKKSRH